MSASTKPSRHPEQTIKAPVIWSQAAFIVFSPFIILEGVEKHLAETYPAFQATFPEGKD